MKTLIIIVSYLASRKSRRNLLILGRLLLIFIALVFTYSVVFHYIMDMEGQQHSWMTGVYWTLVTMSTLGFGDVIFTSDVGKAFSVLVLLSGTIFMLILLPFTFIQFFYLPWMEAQAAARAPRELAPDTKGHVVLTGLGPIESSLIRRLEQIQFPYVLVVADLVEALQLYDQGYRVMVGDLDDPDTYRRLRVDQAALVATTRGDTTNTNVTFTVREISEKVPIVATASSDASVDILQLAGCNRVLQLGEILGQSLARRILGRDAKSHVIGQFGELLIAEAAAANTPMVGQTLRDFRLREYANVNVIGVWNRGKFEVAGPDTRISASTVLVLAGSRDQLDAYDELYCIYKTSHAPVVIIGGGRVGRATGKTLQAEGIDYRIVERVPERVRDPEKYVVGDAAELEVLHRAGIQESSSVVITTHDDDINVYLTIYCRRLRPDIQILGRATLERNVSTLHRAGADFVLSYASMGANMIFNLLQRMDTILLAEGLNVFRVPVPPALAGESIADSAIRQRTGCNIIAVQRQDTLDINPDAATPLPGDAELIVIGDAEAEHRFLSRYSAHE
ncbi:MAG: potassium channel family protein [Gemmataceae bacterium]